jgi:hypothetical protein
MNKSAAFSPKFNDKHFNEKVYFSHLKTRRIGSIILFTELAETTMNSLDK